MHITGDKDGKKDFSPLIQKSLELGGYEHDRSMSGINGGHTLTTGFAHGAVLSHAEKIIESIKKGDIKHIFLVGGCDGAHPGRNYYTDFVKQTPMDSLVLTLACGKYRFNDLDLGEINGIPRILDMFGCAVNELPLTLVLSWYEQKAVCILLTLLSLGLKNMYLGPTLPAFMSENVVKYLVDASIFSRLRHRSRIWMRFWDAGKPVAPRKWRKQIVSEVSSPVERRGVDPGI